MKKNQKDLLLEQLKKTPIVQVACEKVGVSRATYYRWRKEDPKFAKASDLALSEGALLINDMAEMQLMSAIRNRNMQAIMYWLKHHHSSYATKVELSGRITHLREELSDEEKELVEKALRLAMPTQKHDDTDNTK